MPTPKFEIADCWVRLGGDALNTVPKAGVTAAEIAVLQIIHGNDAVREVRPIGTLERTQRVERERLKSIYGNAKDRDGNVLVERLYPGAAARVFETLDELILVDEQFAADRVGRGSTQAQSDAMAAADEGRLLATDAPGDAPVPVADDVGELEELESDDAPVGALD